MEACERNWWSLMNFERRTLLTFNVSVCLSPSGSYNLDVVTFRLPT